MKSNNTQSVRYCLKGRNTFHTEIQINAEGEIKLTGETLVVQIETSFQPIPVFVDILDKPSPYIWKFKLYLANGAVVKECYGNAHLIDQLVLHNYHDLFDGRFNA